MNSDLRRQIQFVGKEFDPVVIESGVKSIISGLNLSLDDPNFEQTPARITRAYWEILEGLLPHAEKELTTELNVTFPCDYDQIITVTGIHCWSMCPHHFLPVEYWIDIGYLPNGKVLGASKLPRAAILLAKRPVLQEQLASDIVTFIHNSTNARGVGVVIKGQHMCMRMRGVKAEDSQMITSEIIGCFRDEPPIKAEFFRMIQYGGSR